MKIAVLLSGSPRFCSEFDSFIDNVVGFEQIDYYCLFWKNNQRPDKLGYPNQVLVPESWRIIDKEWAQSKITSNLPEKHRLVKLETYNDENIELPKIKPGVIDQSINFKNIYKMHLGWHLAFNLLDEEYDLVIRSRPDIGLSQPLDVRVAKNKILERSNLVLNSVSAYFGHQERTNDLIAISSQKNIKIYSDLVNNVEKYSNTENVTFHAENLLGYHLRKNSLTWETFAHVIIRTNLNTNLDGTLSPNFGKWA